MKKNPGRKERRRLKHQDRHTDARLKARRNEFLMKHPEYRAQLKNKKEAER